MKLTIKKTQDAVKDSTGGSYINEEGVFPVRILFASLKPTRNGAVEANFNIEYKGNTQTLYGVTVVNKNGEENAIGMSLLNKLGVIAGMDDGDDLDIEQETHKVGKDNTPTEFEVITNFSDLECYIRVQREYSKYNGKISESLLLRNVFRADDCASAAEIVAGDMENFGKQMELEVEKYTSGPVYRDGVTAEEVAAWKAQKSSGGDKKATASDAVGAVVAKRTSMFSKK